MYEFAGRSTRDLTRQASAFDLFESGAQWLRHRLAAFGGVVVANLHRAGIHDQTPCLSLPHAIYECERLLADPFAANADLEHFAHQGFRPKVDRDVGQDEWHATIIALLIGMLAIHLPR